jgi:hypothetical protein
LPGVQARPPRNAYHATDLPNVCPKTLQSHFGVIACTYRLFDRRLAFGE